MFKLKLFPKFAILLTLLAVIPATIVGLRTININRVGMQLAILELHSNTASSIAETIQNYLQGIDREIQFVIRTISSKTDWLERQSVLQTLLDTNENLVSVSIVNKNGKELLKAFNPDLEKDPKLLILKDNPTFMEFWNHAESSAISQVYYSSKIPRIDIIYPLAKDHCLFAVISLQSIWNMIFQARVASTGFAYMVNKQGAIIAHPDMKLGDTKISVMNLPIVQEAVKAVSVGSKEYRHPLTQKMLVGAYAPVKKLGWGVIIQQDKDEAYISVYKMRNQAAALILISIIAASLFAFFTARGLIKPIMTMTEAAKGIAKKDFSVRVDIKTRDELHELADTFNDMTAELQKYEQLQVDKIIAEKTKTEAVIFSIADGIIMTDLQGRIQLANTRALEILEIPGEGWRDKAIFDYIKHPAMKETFKEIITNPKQKVAKEVDLSIGDLMRFYQLSSEEVITPEKKENIGIVTVVRNITLEKEIEKLKDDFVHSITHDLRNPMTSIRGFLKFLQDGVAGPINEQQKKMLDTMDRASTRLLTLINDILDNAKLEAGRMNLNLGDVDFKFIAQRALELAEGQALKKTIKLSADIAPDIPVIKGDLELLERVFINLVGNALKFTPENGIITIKIEDVEDSIKASVIDTGEGIPSEYLDKIFDKFQQVAGQRKGGTGLGLTICKHVVDAHVGKIWVESKISEGSKFIFTIPKNLTMNKILTHAQQTQKAD
ncbi:MAG: ATP-binding protein [Elusimicrobiota bacterium]